MRACAGALAIALSPALAGAAVETGVSLEVIARTAGTDAANDFSVRDGGVLRTGDGVRLHLRARRDAYVYVIAYGSSHTAALVFPYSARAEDARVRAGSERIIPRSDRFLPLDDVEGRESLFTIVSDEPIEDIDALMARMEAQGEDLIGVTEVVRRAHPDSARLTFKHLGKAPLVGVDLAGVPRSGGGLDAPLDKPAAELSLGGRRFASESLPTDDASRVVGADLGAGAGDTGGTSYVSPGQYGRTSSSAPVGDAAAAQQRAEPSTAASAEREAESAVAAADTRGDVPGDAAVAASVAAAPRADDAARGGEPEAAQPEDRRVAAARERARSRAGIGSVEFQSILSGLPPAQPGGDGSPGPGLPEVGVLSAVGERIRALERRDPSIEQRFQQLERQVPDAPRVDPRQPSEEPDEQSFTGGNEQVSISDPTLPQSPR